MSNIILTADDADALRRTLQHIVIRERTGELGIVHGAGRFVSTNDCIRKSELKKLENAFAKLGVVLGTANSVV